MLVAAGFLPVYKSAGSSELDRLTYLQFSFKLFSSLPSFSNFRIPFFIFSFLLTILLLSSLSIPHLSCPLLSSPLLWRLDWGAAGSKQGSFIFKTQDPEPMKRKHVPRSPRTICNGKTNPVRLCGLCRAEKGVQNLQVSTKGSLYTHTTHSHTNPLKHTHILYTHSHTQTYTHTQTDTKQTHTHTQTRIHTHTYTNSLTNTHILYLTHTRTHTHTHTHTHSNF